MLVDTCSGLARPRSRRPWHDVSQEQLALPRIVITPTRLSLIAWHWACLDRCKPRTLAAHYQGVDDGVVGETWRGLKLAKLLLQPCESCCRYHELSHTTMLVPLSFFAVAALAGTAVAGPRQRRQQLNQTLLTDIELISQYWGELNHSNGCRVPL